MIAIFVLTLAGGTWAEEVIPPSPEHYFNDYTKTISPEVANTLNHELEEFERSTSNQLVVAIYPTMQTDSSLEDYAQRIFYTWKPGQKNINNGAILLVFMNEHKLRIQTGYGLEGALPDAICKRILDDEITPRFRANDYNGGMTAAVHAMIHATKGEYQGTGGTVAERKTPLVFEILGVIFDWAPWVLVPGVIIFNLVRGGRRRYYTSGGKYWTESDWHGNGSWSGGDSGGSGGGGFSGGGGDSGGGGASGSW